MEESKPRVGCATVVMKEGKMLLGLRGHKDGKGLWVVPGGGVKPFEPIRDAAKREIKEETGLDINLLRCIGPYEIIDPPERHRVILYWMADYKSGEIKCGDDTKDAKFFSKEEVKEMLRQEKITGVVAELLKDIGWG
jgi:8-oxo-dGTP diphosphatase